MFLLKLTSMVAMAAVAAGQTINPPVTGNCVSGTYPMTDKSKWILDIPSINRLPTNFSPNKYEFVAQNNAKNMRWPGDRVYFDLKAPPDNAVVRAAWSRYMLYGKITVQLASSKAPGMCSAFITFSDVEDEIDFEMIGAAPNSAYTNVFYKGIAEYTHSTSANIGDISALHTYEIDWTSTAIKWSVDGKLLRTVTPGSENAKSTKLPKGQNWFPNTPSLVMFSIWQGTWAGNADWRTAKQQTASFKNFKVQCYNDKNQPVPEWPVGSSKYVYGDPEKSMRPSELIPGTPCAKTYTVATGDNCEKIATAAKIPVDWFRALNPTIDVQCHNIWVGQDVCIAAGKFGATTTASPVATPGAPSKSSPAGPESALPDPNAPCGKTYTVVAGDTCEKIATAAKISMAWLRALNPTVDADCYNLWVGQKICVTPGTAPATTSSTKAASTTPTAAAVTTPAVLPKAPTTAPVIASPDPNAACTKHYTVESGDTCEKIASAAQISVDWFRALNPAVDANCYNLWVGQTVCVAAGTAPAPKPSATFIPHSYAVPGCVQQYSVAKDDYCYKISDSFGLSLQQFYAINKADLNCDKLEEGQLVCVKAPGASPPAPATSAKATTPSVATSSRSIPAATVKTGTIKIAAPSPATTPKTTAAPVPPAPTVATAASECTRYYVTWGIESCQTIARAIGATMTQFVKMNPHLSPNCPVLPRGTKVCLRSSTFGKRDSSEEIPLEEKIPARRSCNLDTAEEGDSCAHLAIRNDVTEAEVMAWNPGKCEPEVGDILCVSEPVIKRKRRDFDEL